jgi:DNA-binding GntR family transcriptional regulator
LNVAESCYVRIRRGIVEGRYRPHQRLVETDLAKELSASRTPVRQGLQRLELEGLVSASRHGWIVREHSALDIQHIYDVRIALEGYASRLATERAPDEHLEYIEGIHNAALANLEPANRSEFVKLHDEFHDAIVRGAGNAVLADAIRRYREHPYNRRVAHAYSEEELREAVRSHSELLAAICNRSADEAEHLTRAHLALSHDATVQRFAAVPGFMPPETGEQELAEIPSKPTP